MEKVIISRAEFEKRVEIEAQNLMYFDRLKSAEAFDKARREVAQKYTTE